MPVYVKSENIWTQMLPSLLGAAFLLLTLFFNNQTFRYLKQTTSPDAQMERFQQVRRAEVASREYGSELLREAALVVAKTPASIPREAAICLTARQMIDKAISEAMKPATDFAAELEKWNAQSRATEIYCAYAMRVGGN